MNQEEKSVYNFKKGDIITRIKPILGNYGLNNVDKDYSLIGKKIKFLGIANASVYLSKKADFITSFFLGNDEIVFQIPLELCEDGWAFYVEPDFKEAIKNDDFEKVEILKKKLEEKAEILKKKLEEIKNNKK